MADDKDPGASLSDSEKSKKTPLKRPKSRAGLDYKTARWFHDLYRGGPEHVRGKANKCYQEINPGAKDSTALSGGSRYLNDPLVQALLEESAERVSARADVTQEYVLKTIQNTIERCSQAKPVIRNGEPVFVETPDGELAPAYTFDATNVLKGSELLGKHLKMFVDRSENMNVSMSHEEWLDSLK